MAWNLSSKISYLIRSSHNIVSSFYMFTFVFSPSANSQSTRVLHRHRSSRSRLNFFRLSFRNCLSCVITARIFLSFNLSPTVQMNASYIHIHLFILHRYITNSQYDQLPVGLIIQLVEHSVHRHYRGYEFECLSSLKYVHPPLTRPQWPRRFT